jgi:cytochrome c-type biogenesis protein CcmH
MTLWLILTVMTSAAVMWFVVPLVRHIDHPRDETAGDVDIYRDQLQEVERDLQDGRIDAAQAETAQTEIKRRVLAVARLQPASGPGLSGRQRSFAIVGATAAVALGSAILYAVTGNPELASVGSSPSSTFLLASEGRSGALTPRGSAALPPQHPALDGLTDPTFDGGGETQSGLPTVEEMTRRLAARLARNPDDIEGWRTLGWSYLNVGRFDEAATAYAKAMALDPSNTEFQDGHIEALVGAANGVVTPEARTAIGEVLKRDPKDARARYFAGLASEQDGDKAAALTVWTALLTDADAAGHFDESLMSGLRSRANDLKRDMGVYPSEGGAEPATAARLPRPSRAQDGPAASRTADGGLGARDVQTAAAMPPADRSAMIRGMVDGLSSRLERAPRDADGWIKLIRSRVVLGEGDLAKQALTRGLAAFADDAAERDRIAAAAQELGINR